MPITYRDLTTLEEFARVVDLERQIWGPGYDEVVPVPILAVTVKRGGILIGAFDDARAAAGAGPPSEPGQAPAPDLDRMIGATARADSALSSHLFTQIRSLVSVCIPGTFRRLSADNPRVGNSVCAG